MAQKYSKYFRGEIRRGKGGKLSSLVLLILLILFAFSTVAAATCTYTICPTNYGFSPSSGMVSMTVTASSSTCTWTATSNDSWITVTSGSSTTGNGTVTYNVAANTTRSARKGTIAIGGTQGCQAFTARQAGSTFTDDPQNVFTPYIYSIFTEGITVGCGSEMYCPSSYVTRGQMAAFIIRSLYGENFSYTTTPYFNDVSSDSVFFKYVQKMKDTGITAVSGTYMVDDMVTREQMAAFIIRALYGENFDYTRTPYFTDVPATNTFFNYVQKMKDDAITTTTGTYMASSNVTRDQMAAFLGRAFLGMAATTNDLLAGALDYTGPYPTPSPITYTVNGESKTVTAYPGQVIVFFNTPICDTDASRIIISNNGTVLAKIPSVGFYLVQVAVGREQAFITAISSDSNVYTAMPNVVGMPGSSVTLLEGCGDSHYQEVLKALQNNGGVYGGCKNIVDSNNMVNAFKIIKPIIQEGNQNKTGTTLINLSSYGAHLNGVDWSTRDPIVQQELKDEWYTYMRLVCTAIAALPPEYRENFVITICAGNNNMPITDLMKALRLDPKIADVLENNVLVVSTTLMHGNYSTTDPDVAIRDNPEAAGGTSFAAPGALAVIENIMNLTGASAKVALKAVKQAVAANTNHKLIQADAIDKAKAILSGVLPTISLSPAIINATIDCILNPPPSSGSFTLWSGTVSVTVPDNLSWTVNIPQLPEPGSTVTVTPSSGKGSMNVSVVIKYPPKICWCPCSLSWASGRIAEFRYGGQSTTTTPAAVLSVEVDCSSCVCY